MYYIKNMLLSPLLPVSSHEGLAQRELERVLSLFYCLGSRQEQFIPPASTPHRLHAALWHLCCKVPWQGPFPRHS